jgi:5'-3' exonuclease
MIAIGMIVGSDYTEGIANAGIMTALDILQEFHGTCMERLEKFQLVINEHRENVVDRCILVVGGEKRKSLIINVNRKY